MEDLDKYFLIIAIMFLLILLGILIKAGVI
jgi:hypothetical protein